MKTANVTFRKGTNPLFTSKMQIEDWKENTLVAKSTGYNESVASGKIYKISFINEKTGENKERYALKVGDQEITAGNCTAEYEDGRKETFLFALSQKGIILSRQSVVEAAFGV